MYILVLYIAEMSDDWQFTGVVLQNVEVFKCLFWSS